MKGLIIITEEIRELTKAEEDAKNGVVGYMIASGSVYLKGYDQPFMCSNTYHFDTAISEAEIFESFNVADDLAKRVDGRLIRIYDPMARYYE